LENVPVVVVSSENQPETIEKTSALGAYDFIVKPATVDVLEAILKKLSII
jgi:DNA-binding NarL/FixJ family response regulator